MCAALPATSPCAKTAAMIIVTGSVTAKPDTFDAVLAESQAHVRRSRTEDGCISHAVHIDSENPLRLFFYEEWRDMAALQAHFRVPGSIQFITAVRSLAESSEEITILEATPVG
jgi:quinol monooxygenase YgiN